MDAVLGALVAECVCCELTTIVVNSLPSSVRRVPIFHPIFSSTHALSWMMVTVAWSFDASSTSHMK